MGFLFDWLFDKEKFAKQQDENSAKENDSIIPTEDEIEEFEILEDIFEK